MNHHAHISVTLTLVIQNMLELHHMLGKNNLSSDDSTNTYKIIDSILNNGAFEPYVFTNSLLEYMKFRDFMFAPDVIELLIQHGLILDPDALARLTHMIIMEYKYCSKQSQEIYKRIIELLNLDITDNELDGIRKRRQRLSKSRKKRSKYRKRRS